MILASQSQLYIKSLIKWNSRARQFETFVLTLRGEYKKVFIGLFFQFLWMFTFFLNKNGM